LNYVLIAAGLLITTFFVSHFIVPKLRAIFNLCIMSLLFKWLLPGLFERGMAWCEAVVGVTTAATQHSGAFAADHAPAVLASVVAVLVVCCLTRIIARLLYLGLWLLLLVPRFVAGCVAGIAGSFQYVLCAITLTYHPNHSW
jgi:hypothetical protein